MEQLNEGQGVAPEDANEHELGAGAEQQNQGGGDILEAAAAAEAAAKKAEEEAAAAEAAAAKKAEEQEGEPQTHHPERGFVAESTERVQSSDGNRVFVPGVGFVDVSHPD